MNATGCPSINLLPNREGLYACGQLQIGFLTLTDYLILIQTFPDNVKKNVTCTLYICIN
jgi:hypothetical protein